MSTGWIKLHRKILDSRVFANDGLLKVWVYCLCRANHEHNYVDIRTGKGKTEVEVKAGQFIFGRNSASRDLNMNPSTVYKRMQKLEGMGNINIQSNSHYSVVSVCNWEVYQDKDNEKEQPKEQASNNQVTGREQAGNTDNNDKNVKNDKNNILVAGKAFDANTKIVDVMDRVDLSDTPTSNEEKQALLALHVWNDVHNLRPNNQTTLKAKLGSWYDPVRLMIEQDERTLEDIWRLWKKVQRDGFWQKNILSTAKLREKFDQVAINLNKSNGRDIHAEIDSLYE